MNYSAYQHILEYVPNNTCNLENLKENDIFKYVDNFLKKINCKTYLISLSGGVDSMVFCVISKLLTILYKDINFFCCHLNYNNRSQSTDEMNFLVDWCRHNSIHLDIKNICHIHRGDGNRNDYEIETRNIRYTFYKDLIEKHNCDGVVLAHHKDDYSENVFNNIMRGKNNIMNLGVFKEENIIHNVKVLRPLLKFIKKDIYNISEEYQIPYFLDTTPKWSCRGKMRNEIFPNCKDCYGEIFMNNIHSIGLQSECLNNIIENHLINPILNSVFYGKFGFKIPKSPCLKEQVILESVLNSITFNLGLKTIKKKNIKLIIEKFYQEIELNIIKEYKCFVLENYIIFVKIEEIINIFKNNNLLDFKISILNNIYDVSFYNYLLEGNIFYWTNYKNFQIVQKGKKSNRFKKLNINNLINRYIPNLYFKNESLAEKNNNYLMLNIQ